MLYAKLVKVQTHILSAQSLEIIIETRKFVAIELETL